MIDVPVVAVYWDRVSGSNLQEPANVETAHQALVTEGTTADREALLNEDLLRRLWPKLILPERCRHT